MFQKRFLAIILLIAGLGVGYWDYTSQISTADTEASKPFKLGLDLSGGTHLIYEADLTSVEPTETTKSMEALRDVIENRVNLFGVAEPLVQIERGALDENGERSQRLIVELPGVTDVAEAVDMIGDTPVLEFKIERQEEDALRYQQAIQDLQAAMEAGVQDFVPDDILSEGPYLDTGLTGKFLDRARVEFNSNSGEPYVAIKFDAEGTELFKDITSDNVGRVLAIYLDGALIQEPVIRDVIRNGEAIISGGFSPDEARELAGRLNSGALPVDSLELLSTQSVGPSLGAQATEAGVRAGMWGLLMVSLFLILWYRLPGVLAVVALSIYLAIVFAIFKFIPVTLTAAGIAGLVLSIGMAVDANILIFERMKEELRRGRGLEEAVEEGFNRAWLSIRDGNLSSIITAGILFWFGTSLVEGFALTFAIGILVSMFSAITLTRSFLRAIAQGDNEGFKKVLFGSGFTGKPDAGK